MADEMVPMRLGMNGLGRIGKLTLWHHVERRYFSEIVVNIGREVGGGLQDLASFIEKDSTYGALNRHLHGYRAGPVIEELNDAEGSMRVNGVKVTFLTSERNPARLGWRERGVELVVDATGAFLDPTVPADDPKGSVRGHIASGARKVIVSAPFKIREKGREMPADAVTTVIGVNDHDVDMQRHAVISHASCTTTCLAYMVKPLLDAFGAHRVLSASMTTVHAATSTQPVLDRAPGPKAKDLRKTRSVLNNIILTSTGAAKALSLVIPEMKRIGFIAESVRVPVATGSLVILVVLIQDDSMQHPVNRERVNGVYREARKHFPDGYLVCTDDQNVSSDIVGFPGAATVIEAQETHTRTAAVRLADPADPSKILEVPVTSAVIYGWYDNELGSYTNMLGECTARIARELSR